MRLKLCCILPLLINALAGQEAADFFVVSDPRAYTIYNHYEQPVTDEEKAVFAPYSPFRIIEKDILLGDQITRALKFVFQRETFYLLKDEDGKYEGNQHASGIKAFSGVALFEDTIEIRGSGLTIASMDGGHRPIPKGTLVVRVFRSGPRWYCTAFLDRMVYGWSSLEPRSAWRKPECAVPAESAVKKDSTFPEYLRQKVRARFASVNKSYRTCFSHFNTLTGNEKSVPQWNCEDRGGRLRCRLSVPYANGHQLFESSRSLAQEIGALFAGTDFRVTCKGGEITVDNRGSGD
ncbi:MAG: hypothetical protein JW768_13980 [Chitinispirillaceae bacterium]|nr:hypothetical protein [Chitinispirillaceae bacterium]